MKRILIHIGSLNAGGAEKSLVSFLNTLPKGKYEIDLMVLRQGGLFHSLVPSFVNIILPPFPYCCLGISPKKWRFYIKHAPKYLIKKLISLYKIKKTKNKSLDQILWLDWQNDVKCFEKSYDVAISYLEGITNYYVIDKVKANKKIIWVHNEYSKLGYCKDFDTIYLEKADAVVTISKLCKENLISNFPMLESKIHILENITNPEIVRSMALEPIVDFCFYSDVHTFKILSVGRLTPQKNYALAINAAKVLKEMGVNFKWYIIGEGPLRRDLEELIVRLSLVDNVTLLGIRSNPYAYMKKCDIIVQSSLFEGKSIAIDEAKILCKPIVVTSYDTVYDVITDGETGLISDMDPTSLANKIYQLYASNKLRTQLSSTLSNFCGNVSEINKYMELIDK